MRRKSARARRVSATAAVPVPNSLHRPLDVRRQLSKKHAIGGGKAPERNRRRWTRSRSARGRDHGTIADECAKAAAAGAAM